MVAKVSAAMKSPSWVQEGLYSRLRLSRAVIAACVPYRFAAITDVAARAAEEAA